MVTPVNIFIKGLELWKEKALERPQNVLDSRCRNPGLVSKHTVHTNIHTLCSFQDICKLVVPEMDARFHRMWCGVMWYNSLLLML